VAQEEETPVIVGTSAIPHAGLQVAFRTQEDSVIPPEDSGVVSDVYGTTSSPNSEKTVGLKMAHPSETTKSSEGNQQRRSARLMAKKVQ
jgi:hypothetical protein